MTSSSPTRVLARPGVYATHGHFLDRHLTVPTFERLAVAAVERVLSTGGESTGPEAEPERGSATPDDYERSQAPVYAFLFALAQAGAPRSALGAQTPRPGSGRRWGAATAERRSFGAGCSARSPSRGPWGWRIASAWDLSGRTSRRGA